MISVNNFCLKYHADQITKYSASETKGAEYTNAHVYLQLYTSIKKYFTGIINCQLSTSQDISWILSKYWLYFPFQNYKKIIRLPKKVNFSSLTTVKVEFLPIKFPTNFSAFNDNIFFFGFSAFYVFFVVSCPAVSFQPFCIHSVIRFHVHIDINFIAKSWLLVFLI